MAQASLQKIVNPDLAQAALRGTIRHGEFRAYVRLAKPEKKSPYMEVLGSHSPGLIKARIRCDEINQAAEDNNVVSIELREYISSNRSRLK